tara:strand:- start:1943 stop:3406 length:1464 start_codon:yes stop_codon:yes gene_type:complete
MTHHIAIVGAGTAGIIAASYIKSYWKDRVKVTLIYDHSNPGIGVGESTTPIILEYLEKVGIGVDELIANTNSTLKLGIKFKNWLNDGEYYYHGFGEFEDQTTGIDFNASYAYEVIQNTRHYDTHYDEYYYENNICPSELGAFAVHINTLTFSQYIQEKFKDDIDIVDGVVAHAATNNNRIKTLYLSNGDRIDADFYIDATGFSRSLIKELNPGWVDKSDYVPNNTAIPFHINKSYDYIPPYTLAEASKDGWIWQIPLSNRYGSGYIFSDKFTEVEDARRSYDTWLNENHGVSLDTDALIHFDSGYLENQWVGNCLSVGLASGFVEPLESTSVHITVMQSIAFCLKYPLQELQYSIDTYNKYFNSLYEEIYDFVRYHYYTKRQDSPFWSYMTNNTPSWITNLEEKMKVDFLRPEDFSGNTVFECPSYSAVSYGLQLLDAYDARRYLANRELFEQGKMRYEYLLSLKSQNAQRCFSHKSYIDAVLTNSQ